MCGFESLSRHQLSRHEIALGVFSEGFILFRLRIQKKLLMAARHLVTNDHRGYHRVPYGVGYLEGGGVVSVRSLSRHDRHLNHVGLV